MQRNHATSRMVAGSIPAGGTGILLGLDPSCRSTALGSTRPLTEKNARDISWGGKGGRCIGLTVLTIFMCRLSRNYGILILLEPCGPVQTCIGIVLDGCFGRPFVHASTD